jgi:hypothetical protein
VLVNVKVPVGLILGDMQGGDKHCGSVVGYSKQMARLCRQCNIAGDESGDPLVKCWNMCWMEKSRRYVASPRTTCILPGLIVTLEDVNWVFSAPPCPAEALHAVEGGICKDATAILFVEDLKDANCRLLDLQVKLLCAMDKQHYITLGSDKAMPHILFKDGVTNLAKLPTAHVIGILLTVVIITLTDKGKLLLQTAFASGKAPADEARGIKRLNDMWYMFSMLLVYWSWLKQETFWECGDRKAQKRAQWAIRKMLLELIQLWPREASHVVGSNPRYTSSCMCQATSPVMVPHAIRTHQTGGEQSSRR